MYAASISIPVCPSLGRSILFIYLVCALPLTRSIYCKVDNAEKLEKIVNKLIDRLYDTVLMLFITTERSLDGHHFVCNLPWLYDGCSLSYKATGWLWIYTPSINIVFPSSHEIRIGFVSSLLGYLMYVRKQIETNANTNMNKVIMTKLYGISCYHLCCCLCHHLCCQLLCRHVQLIIYCMIEPWEQYKRMITLFATLFLLLLLLLIVIYDCFGTNDETIIMFGMLVNDDVNLLVEFVVTSVSVPICSPQDIYYTSIPSIYVQLGDAVDCFIWWCHVGTDELVRRW